jgi:RNA polymerase sigma-70 factor (ECF subfamily)
VLSGDRAAFAELYDRRARLVRAICFDATHDADATADLTQETFLRAYMKLGTLRDPQLFSAWLVGIARQVSREWRRGRLRDRRWQAGQGLRADQRPPDGPYRPVDDPCRPADSCGSAAAEYRQADERCPHARLDVEAVAAPDAPHDERIAALRAALAALPERERLSLHAFYLQGLDVEQAGAVLGLSRSGVYRLLACARQRLRKLLSRQEVLP